MLTLRFALLTLVPGAGCWVKPSPPLSSFPSPPSTPLLPSASSTLPSRRCCCRTASKASVSRFSLRELRHARDATFILSVRPTRSSCRRDPKARHQSSIFSQLAYEGCAPSTSPWRSPEPVTAPFGAPVHPPLSNIVLDIPMNSLAPGPAPVYRHEQFVRRSAPAPVRPRPADLRHTAPALEPRSSGRNGLHQAAPPGASPGGDRRQ